MRILNASAGQWIGLSLTIALSLGFWNSSSADLVHFANGNNLRGKLDRMTGDIIEFRRSKHFFGNMDYFKRIQLTDRHDVIETRSGQKYFGEVIYMDDLTLEIQTAAGNVRLNRMALTNVVLGSPLQAPHTPGMNQVSLLQQQFTPPEPPNAPITGKSTILPSSDD